MSDQNETILVRTGASRTTSNCLQVNELAAILTFVSKDISTNGLSAYNVSEDISNIKLNIHAPIILAIRLIKEGKVRLKVRRWVGFTTDADGIERKTYDDWRLCEMSKYYVIMLDKLFT